jgi:DNA-binding NarL/FixJ family response regulator
LTVNVFIIEEHPVVREGLIRILDAEHDLQVMGSADSGESAFEAMRDIEPDVIVLDYRLSDMDGVRFCQQAAQRRVRGEIVMLSGYLEDEAIEASLTAGARAYIIKDSEPDELKRAIRAAARGETVIDPKVAGKVVTWATRRGSARGSGRPDLRPQELEILKLASEGKPNQAIAEAIGVTIDVVKSNFKRIFRQLEAGGRAEAVLVALRRGLI